MPRGWEPEKRHRKVRDCVAEMFGVEPRLMPSAARPAYISSARMVGYWIVRQVFPELSFDCVGQLYGGRDHSTVISGLRKIEQRRDNDPDFRELTDAILAAIGTPPPPEAPSLETIQRIALHRLPDHQRGEDFEQLFKKSAAPDKVTSAIAADVESEGPHLRAVP